MPPEAEVALLRVAQEALANVAKHAGTAARIGITLSYMDQQVALDVRDDGRGFDPDAHLWNDGGFGLVAMRQRIEALSGTLQIESEVDGGTGISACLPIEASEVGS
jgi:signal transduction histidine kinase